jgi:menaquinone-dependent protoporphyrinogen IX oxidase
MINGFEDETGPLSDYELDLVPVIVKGLSVRYGKEKAITNKQMVKALKSADWKVSGARIRKIINHIRTTGQLQLLVASSKGYYLATEPEEVEKYVESLRQRASAIYSVGKALQKQYNDNFFDRQMKLF